MWHLHTVSNHRLQLHFDMSSGEAVTPKRGHLWPNVLLQLVLVRPELAEHEIFSIMYTREAVVRGA